MPMPSPNGHPNIHLSGLPLKMPEEGVWSPTCVTPRRKQENPVVDFTTGQELMLSLGACQRQLLSSCMDRLEQAEAMLANVRLSLGHLHEDSMPKSQADPGGPRGGGSKDDALAPSVGWVSELGDSWKKRDVSEGDTDRTQMYKVLHYSRMDSNVTGGDQASSEQTSDIGKKRYPQTNLSLHDSTKPRKSSWSAFDASAKNPSHIVDQVIVQALDSADKTLQLQMSFNETATDSVDDDLLGRGNVETVWMPLSQKWPQFQVPILHPEGVVHLSWLFVGFLFITWEVYWVPFALSFQVSPTGALLVLVSVINSYFLADIILNFITGFHDALGVVVRDPLKIIERYARGWLLLDVVAGVPWEWIPDTGAASMTRGLRVVRSLRLLRLARLLRLVKLKSFMSQAEAIIEANSLMIFFMGVMRVLFALYGITHMAACIWYVVGSTHDDQSDETSWLQHPLLANTSIDSNPWETYVYSLYFTLTTMTTVGYGDITAARFPEVVFVLALLCIASVVFAGLMGVLMDLITQLNSSAHMKQEKKTDLSRYLKWRDVPRPLAKAIRDHLVFLWDTNGSYDEYEEDIKNQLPPVLKVDLCNHIYGHVLRQAPFLNWMATYSPCIKKLAESVHSVFLVAGDHVFKIGDVCEEIHFLITGTVYLSRNTSVYDKGRHLLFDQDDAALHKDLSLPRNTASGMEDIRKGINEKARHIKELGAKLSMHERIQAEGVMEKFATMSKIQSAASDESDPQGFAKRVGARRVYDLFDSDVFRDATLELMRHDKKRKSGAVTIQKAWRKRTVFNSWKSRGTARCVSKLQSKKMRAPAYFGESCLWVPYKLWGEDQTEYLYSAVCAHRLTCELVEIPRSAVQEVIESFSPWLLERFEIFQQSVLSGLTGAMTSSVRSGIVDWAAIDLHPPLPDEEKFGEMHVETLRRSTLNWSLPPTVPQPSKHDRTEAMYKRAGSGSLSRSGSGSLSHRKQMTSPDLRQTNDHQHGQQRRGRSADHLHPERRISHPPERRNSHANPYIAAAAERFRAPLVIKEASS